SFDRMAALIGQATGLQCFFDFQRGDVLEFFSQGLDGRDDIQTVVAIESLMQPVLPALTCPPLETTSFYRQPSAAWKQKKGLKIVSSWLA
ncbi:MAG: hypothetical protein R6X07_06400, partial [Desulfatiglandales bacterium]